VNRPDVFIEPHIMVDICGNSLAASYKDLFIDDDLGAIADLPGMTPMDPILWRLSGNPATYAKPTALQELVGKLIDEEQDQLLKAVVQYAADLVNLDEDGNATPESQAEVTEWLDKNELTESLQRLMAAEVVA